MSHPEFIFYFIPHCLIFWPQTDGISSYDKMQLKFKLKKYSSKLIMADSVFYNKNIHGNIISMTTR